MAKRGRPTKFNEEIAEKIIRALKTGVSLAVAARYSGIEPDVVRQWMTRNVDFVTKCRKAQAEKEVRASLKETKLIESGDVRVIEKYLDRVERNRNHREMERLRREEINLKRNGNAMEVLPVVLDVQKVIDELEGNTGEVSEPAGD